ncbi:E3 ubiquitin-protein ligase rnf168 isoform 1-T2 [Odontesthes bonariensis]|uniref:E3 ubiquitin-protein ligase rnf168 n=1 Tax=Odontesthes bonariensis TaxID=219752 RepID=UPI003F5845C7
MGPVSERALTRGHGALTRGDEALTRGDEALTREDVLCTVCLEIFMEPVTLPCSHTFCKGCFLESVHKATLCCPLCRKRVSTWARLHSKDNSLVDQQLWTRIQTCFPLQCQRREEEGEDEELPVSVVFPRVCQPGELRQEYEDEVTKLKEERRQLEEEEQRASKELIQRLLQEEEELLQQERRRGNEDEQLARLLSNQLNSPPVPQENVRPADVTKKKKEAAAGQMERFLCPRAAQSSSTTFLSNKENILVSGAELQAELQVEPPLPRLDYYGPQTEELHPEESHRSHKRPSSELETPEETAAKRVLISSSVGPATSDREAELQVRRRQEEEDRRLAMILQKELDEEERQRATDRRKGSSDAYLLRQKGEGQEGGGQKGGGREEAGCTNRPRRSASKKKGSTSSTSSTSSSTSSTPSTRGSKQTTLIQMFSSLSR